MDLEKSFWTVMLIFFIIFISIFMASKSGYYEYENRNRKEFTEEKIKEFEEDVKLGKNIDIKDYLTDNEKNYENKVTKIGETASSLITNGVTKGIEGTIKVFEKLFN